MKRKIFIGILLVCLVVPLLVFGAYSLGANNNYYAGFDAGIAASKEYEQTWRSNIYNEGYTNGFSRGNQTGYLAGLDASQNNTVP